MTRIFKLSWAVLLILMATGCTSKKIISKAVSRQIKVTVPPEYVHEKESIVVVTVGTASPLPGERSQTGTAIFVNGYFFMFDAGAGVVQGTHYFTYLAFPALLGIKM